MDDSAPSNITTPTSTQTTAVSSETSSSGSTDQIRKLGEQVEQAHLPPDLKQNLIERVSRLALIRQGSGFLSPNYITEYESTSNYIEWVLGLPWDTQSQDVLDLVQARQVLDKNHYGIENVKTAILEYLSTIILNSRRTEGHKIGHAPVICLIGLAGTGKTTLAISIAEALGRKFERIPFGGMADSRALRGQSRVFPDAEPGAVVKKLIHAGTKNPVILLDELDRVTEAARGDIMGVLLELLDPGQNKAYTDHYVDYPFDLSNVLFVATGNNTTNISTAVLDRLQILQMPSYTDQEKIAIAHSYLFNRIRQDTGLEENEITIDETVWPHIIRPLGFDSGIRSLERTIAGMCRKVARIIVEGKMQQIHITDANVKEFLPSW